MTIIIIKADPGWFALFAIPGDEWTFQRLPVIAWRIDASEDEPPFAEPVTVVGNGTLEDWKPGLQFEDGAVHFCGETYATPDEWLADIERDAAVREAVQQ